MTVMVVKVVDRTKPELVAQAEGELLGAGFTLRYKSDAEFLGIDTVKHGGDESNFGPAVVLVGTK